jgi:uncharacterized protein YbaR (Trm112 family)
MEKELLEIICCPDDKEDLKLKKDVLKDLENLNRVNHV